MILGIDASNIRSGGGLTHLVELLQAADPINDGFSKVVVWSGKSTLGRIEDRPWLVKSYQPLLDKALPWRIFWQQFRLATLAKDSGCDMLFAPGGSYGGDFRPFVTMSRNLLPFQWREMRRYGFSLVVFKLLLLRLSQSRTFRRADGLIFLTQYAKNAVLRVIKTTDGKTTIIPHGIDERFRRFPQEQFPIASYSKKSPFRILYVSHIEQYKHQWNTVEAAALLREDGYPVVLDLVGPNGNAINRLNKTLSRLDPKGEFVRCWGAVSHAEIHTRYAKTDLCLFASSCENMPNILLEGMASGLPIACSNMGPMPEVLGDAGVYFDPENSRDIARALKELIESPELRAKLAKASLERSQGYSWRRCAEETFAFLDDVTRTTL